MKREIEMLYFILEMMKDDNFNADDYYYMKRTYKSILEVKLEKKYRNFFLSKLESKEYEWGYTSKISGYRVRKRSKIR